MEGDADGGVENDVESGAGCFAQAGEEGDT